MSDVEKMLDAISMAVVALVPACLLGGFLVSLSYGGFKIIVAVISKGSKGEGLLYLLLSLVLLILFYVYAGGRIDT